MAEVAGKIGDRIESLDTSLFDLISTQSSDGDRRAWLAVQRAIRRSSGYAYLEIGSHLGGSIQQHVVDPLCRQIVSIDKRPLIQPDDRGQDFHYEGNSTQRMLDNLKRVSTEGTSKIICFDADASQIDRTQIPAPPDFCFIDGEHTYSAVLSDFDFCLKVCAPDAAICFHDDIVTHRALSEILGNLRRMAIPFTARKLTGVTFGIFLRDCRATNDPYILSHSKDADAWLRYKKLKDWVPGWLQPAARGAAKLLGRK
jgi:hypothetical protein